MVDFVGFLFFFFPLFGEEEVDEIKRQAIDWSLLTKYMALCLMLETAKTVVWERLLSVSDKML